MFLTYPTPQAVLSIKRKSSLSKLAGSMPLRWLVRAEPWMKKSISQISGVGTKKHVSEYGGGLCSSPDYNLSKARLIMDPLSPSSSIWSEHCGSNPDIEWFSDVFQSASPPFCTLVIPTSKLERPTISASLFNRPSILDMNPVQSLNMLSLLLSYSAQAAVSIRPQ